MTGLWINHIQYGRARDMARFGLLMLANGVWSGDTLLRNQQYLYDMVHPSQTLNRSYGYLLVAQWPAKFHAAGFATGHTGQGCAECSRRHVHGPG